MTATARVLVAGIGNIFLGDDGFGVETVRAFQALEAPPGVRVEDFGIRGFDLAYAMLEDLEAVVLVDAVSRGETPGTLFVIEATSDAEPGGAGERVEGHVMTPGAVLALVRSMGGGPRRVLVLGCEPESFGAENLGRMGLSDTVAGAVPHAVRMLGDVLTTLLSGGPAAQPAVTEIRSPSGG